MAMASREAGQDGIWIFKSYIRYNYWLTGSGLGKARVRHCLSLP
ncbi:MAG: hypothetical protein RLZZ555_309 [Pseudomonadota bacterium]|jgi:hypothetical protein